MGNDVFNINVDDAPDGGGCIVDLEIHKYLSAGRRDEVLKIECTFQLNKHTFKCTKCGKCCYPAGLSLTSKEYEYFLKMLIHHEGLVQDLNPPFTHILKLKGKCPFLTDKKLCKIYQDRPIVCMSFPLTFEYLPEDRLFVNFIRCEGDDIEGGEIVDENFVLNIIDMIEKKNQIFSTTC